MAGGNINDGTRDLPFTCENRGYRTDISHGYEHHQGEGYRGSATRTAIYEEEGDYSLWLEHAVKVSNSNDRTLWLIWYTPDGRPSIPGGALISKDWRTIFRVCRGLIKVKLLGR